MNVDLLPRQANLETGQTRLREFCAYQSVEKTVQEGRLAFCNAEFGVEIRVPRRAIYADQAGRPSTSPPPELA